MKIFTHTFKVKIFEDGRLCWKNARWEERDDFDSINFWVGFAIGVFIGRIF